MRPWVIEVGLGALSVGAWLGLYAVMLLVTRPRGVAAAPATQDLGDEPPAVASLVGNGWDLTEDAAEATLLDLGGRDILEFRQPANDPTHTTVHILQSNPTGLLPYERRVFDRVSGLAVGGLLPLTALTFRDQKQAQAWWKGLRGEVVADARARGLSQRRFGRTQIAILTAGAAVAAAGIAVAVGHYAFRGDDDDPIGTIIAAGVVGFLVLAGIGGRNVGERDTPAGREAAARWLGVKAWLRAHDSFAELPPSAVAVWDRYLGYGAALGATRVSSRVIDLGMGNRRLVWSSFGGTWHRVRVRYPKFWPRYGRPVPILVLRAVLALAVGYALVRWWRPAISELSDLDSVRRFAGPLSPAGFALGVGLLGYGAYAIVRVVVDAIVPVRLTGQVLWIEVWRQTARKEDSPPKPWLHYIAIDDGRSDRTVAWGLPSDYALVCDTGQTVTVTIRRWSRRVVALTTAPPSLPPAAPHDRVDHEPKVMIDGSE